MYLQGFKCLKCSKTFDIDLDDNPNNNILYCPKCKSKYFVDIDNEGLNINLVDSGFKMFFKKLSRANKYSNSKKRVEKISREFMNEINIFLGIIFITLLAYALIFKPSFLWYILFLLGFWILIKFGFF